MVIGEGGYSKVSFDYERYSLIPYVFKIINKKDTSEEDFNCENRIIKAIVREPILFQKVLGYNQYYSQKFWGMENKLIMII